MKVIRYLPGDVIGYVDATCDECGCDFEVEYEYDDTPMNNNAISFEPETVIEELLLDDIAELMLYDMESLKKAIDSVRQ